MRKADKLDRYRTLAIARLTQQHDVPFWLTLSPLEHRRLPPHEVRQFYCQNADDRRRFRNFIRSIAAHGVPTRPAT
jgi:hypothetical protein